MAKPVSSPGFKPVWVKLAYRSLSPAAQKDILGCAPFRAIDVSPRCDGSRASISQDEPVLPMAYLSSPPLLLRYEM